MPLLKSITGAKYGASILSYFNAADTVDTLLALTASANLAFEASTDFDFTTTALGFATADKGASITFRANNQAEFCTADYDGIVNTSDYYLSFWLRGILLPGESPPLTQTTEISRQHGTADSVFYFSTNSVNADDAFSPRVFTNVGGGLNPLLDFASGTTGSTGYALWNKWNKICIHWRRAAGSSLGGLMELFVNGRLIQQITQVDHSNSQIGLGSGSERSYVLPAWANVKWQLGPIESWSGNDFTIRPLFSRQPPVRPVDKSFLPHFIAGGAAPSLGRDWVFSGTGAAAGLSYGASGTTPYRSRMQLSGSGNQPVVTSVDALGGPFYYRGWQTVALADVCVPNGAALKIELLDAANTTPVLTFNISGGKFKQDATDVLNWSQPSTPSATNQIRYAVFIHLSQTGTAAVTLFDITNATSSVQTAFSAVLAGGWTPQTFGKVRLTADPLAVPVEVGPVGIGSEFDISQTDSLTCTTYTNSSTIHGIATANGLIRNLNYLQEKQLIPGGCWNPNPYNIDIMKAGAPFSQVWAQSGRSGLSRAQWTANVLPGLTYSRNLRMVAVDFGSINDIIGISGNAAAVTATMITNAESMVNTLCANGNRVWFASMLTRDKSTQVTYNAEKLGAITTLNASLRTKVKEWGVKYPGQIQFTDIALDYTNNRASYPTGDAMWADDTHPSTAGFSAIALRMFATNSEPRIIQNRGMRMALGIQL